MRWLLLGILAFVTGCAGVRPVAEPTPNAERNAAILAEIARALPGDYRTAASRQQRETGDEPLWLSVRREAAGDPAQVVFTLAQRQGEGRERLFRLGLASRSDSEELTGFFAPTEPSGRVQRSCALTISIRSDGFSGVTDPATCRFGGETGLLKEIAFDGRQLVIGDRLVRLPDGQVRGPDQVHAFFRVHAYSGWAGIRAGEDWLRADVFQLHGGGDVLALQDAAGMPLGVSVELTRYIVSAGESPLLRLRAFDSETGEVLAESWADSDARSLGLALPDFQIGLERSNGGPR